MLRAHQRSGGSFRGFSATTGATNPLMAGHLVRVRNDSGANVEQFNVLGIADQVFVLPTDLDEFKRHAVLSGIAPVAAEHANRFVITAEPIKNGEIGRAYIGGVCICQVDVADEALTYAGVTDADATKLTAAVSGPIHILWKEVGTGLLWAVVRFSPPPVDRFNARITTSDGPAHQWVEVTRNGDGWEDVVGGRTSVDLGPAFEYNGREKAIEGLIVIMEAVTDETGTQYRFDLTYGTADAPQLLPDGDGPQPDTTIWEVNNQPPGSTGWQSPGPVFRVYMGNPNDGHPPIVFRRQMTVDSNGNDYEVLGEIATPGKLVDVVDGVALTGTTLTVGWRRLGVFSEGELPDSSIDLGAMGALTDQLVAISDGCAAGFLSDVLQFNGNVSVDTAGCVMTVTVGGPDWKVLVSSNDTTPGFLGDKLISGDAWIGVAELNDGNDEIIEVTHQDPQPAHDSITAVSDVDVVDVSGIMTLRVTTSVTSYDAKGHKTGSTTANEEFPLVSKTFVTDVQVSGTTLQKKTIEGWFLALGTESAWTTFHTGDECEA